MRLLWDEKNIIHPVLKFIDNCQIEKEFWKFSSLSGGPETLYASCFACMLLHYLGELKNFSHSQKQEWAGYLNSWQDFKTGYFIGPELIIDELSSPKHTYEHVAQHLTAHVLPALQLLEAEPQYPLDFAHPFMDLKFLHHWLNQRDWSDAWLEGNNLLFVGQFLIHLRDIEKKNTAQSAIELYFDWLDDKVDPLTGLWGTDGFCSPFVAMCGGYHQLLVYYYEDRNIRYKKQLIDTVLSLQHPDGGFSPHGGGGACEDVDAADILINMYKQINYKRAEIRAALRRLLKSVLEKQMPDGGFVYRLNAPFIHMGIPKTFSEANCSNLFPTWFRLHTIALISEILTDDPEIRHHWQFNTICSMGWHRSWDKSDHSITLMDKLNELPSQLRVNFTNKLQLKDRLKKYLPYKIIRIIEKLR